jgi:hypothetical protein
MEFLEGTEGERAGRPEGPEGGVGGALPAGAAVEDLDLGAGEGEPPGAGKPHHPPTDDQDLHGRTPSDDDGAANEVPGEMKGRSGAAGSGPKVRLTMR